eukprot:TRINITY_DN107089_c0_g1_i1.p1 TRINITY_DN107089_c0_g1~~TRINITY_DN107089_c0_g1_i1.p1  ORF type:complete len:135 (-),score=2.02 TRINITY_DN107089_c0_g1_i1:109-513(-)
MPDALFVLNEIGYAFGGLFLCMIIGGVAGLFLGWWAGPYLSGTMWIAACGLIGAGLYSLVQELDSVVERRTVKDRSLRAMQILPMYFPTILIVFSFMGFVMGLILSHDDDDEWAGEARKSLAAENRRPTKRKFE